MHNEFLLQRACIVGKAFAFGTTLVGILILGGVQRSVAAAAPTNSMKFSETYTEKIVCESASGGPACAKIGRDQFVITAKVLLSAVDVTTFTYTNVLVVNLGGLHLTNQLAFDPRYLPGKKTVRILRITRDPENKTQVSYLMTANWNESMLKVTIIGRMVDVSLPEAQPLVAASLTGTPSGPVDGTIDGLVSLGGAVAEFNGLPFSGNAVTKDKTGKDGSPFVISKITVKGKI